MTGIDLRSTMPAAHDLRAQVREEVEEEYLRLRTVDRPALLDTLAQMPLGDSPDAAVIEDELTLLDRRIAALQTYLGTVRTPAETGRPAVDYCVQVDLGDGPRWLLLTDLPVLDERVVTVESSLGKALLGARVGDAFEFQRLHGPHTGRLLAVEADSPGEGSGVAAFRSRVPAPRPPVPLERARAWELLGLRNPGVGRLAFNLFGVPHIEVVNFFLDGADVIFRIAPGSKLSAVSYGGHFALQVDELDWASHSGWTVTVTGPVQRVRGVDADRLVEQLTPWAAGDRDYVIRMKPRRVVGRELGDSS